MAVLRQIKKAVQNPKKRPAAETPDFALRGGIARRFVATWHFPIR